MTKLILDFDRLSTPLDLMREQDLSLIACVCDALASPVRLRLLRLLQDPPYHRTIAEFMQELGVPKSTLLHHLNKMEQAHLIYYKYQPSVGGMVRHAYRALQHLDINLYNQPNSHRSPQTYDFQTMPVGHFADFEGSSFAFATETQLYKPSHAVFIPERFDAQLIYTTNGIVTYYFDNAIARKQDVSELTVTMEICAEAPFYDPKYKSDITFWINDRKLTSHTLVGDFGDRKGHLTPAWWPNNSTEYGVLLSLTVNGKGIFVNGVCTSTEMTLDDLDLARGNKIKFAFGNDLSALHPGGFNLFGKKFGDHPQDIVLRLSYTDKA